LLAFLDTLPALGALQEPAPVLVVPHVFEPELCRTLIRLHEQQGGYDSPYVRNIDGKTVSVLNPDVKRRWDYVLTQPDIVETVTNRLRDCLLPQIMKAFHFGVTRIERYLV